MISLRVASLLVLAWAGAAAAQAPLVRLGGGLAFEVPRDWRWGDLRPESVTLAPGAMKLPGGLVLGYGGVDVEIGRYADVSPQRWERVTRDQRARLPNSAAIRYRIGEPWGGGLKAFEGTIEIGRHRVRFFVREVPRKATLDMAEIERGFLHISNSAREVPRNADVYHPVAGFAMRAIGDNQTWTSGAYTRGTMLYFYCLASICEPKGVPLRVYPSSAAYATLDDALANITGHFSRQGVKIGPTSRLQSPGGEAAWTEQPGTEYPLLAAVRREGSYYFVSFGPDTSRRADLRKVKAGFTELLQSVRPAEPR